MVERLVVGLAVNALFAVVALRTHALSRSGAIAGVLLGSTLWLAVGAAGFAVLASFVVVASFATRLGAGRKSALGVAERHGGRRGWRNALANAGAALVCAALAAVSDEPGPWLFAYVAALATAASDTVASEIGQAWGGRPFLITNGRRVAPGCDGGVTVVGTASGLLAALLVAGTAVAAGSLPTGGRPLAAIGIVAWAALAGTFVDSLLGATVQSRGRIDNDGVNLLATLAGAVGAWIAAGGLFQGG